MTLDLHMVAKAFSDMLVVLGKMRGIAGHLLSYVMRPTLKGPYDAGMDNDTEDPHPLASKGAPISQLTMSFILGPPYCSLTCPTPSSPQSLRP